MSPLRRAFLLGISFSGLWATFARAWRHGRVTGPDVPVLTIALSGTSVVDDVQVGSTVGTLSVTGGSGAYTYSITSDPDSKFVVDNGVPVLAAAGPGINLSGANLVATGDGSTGTTSVVRENNGISGSSDYYFEVAVTGTSGNEHTSVGIIGANSSNFIALGPYLGSEAQSVGFYDDGAMYLNGAQVDTGPTFIGTHTVGVLVKRSNNTVSYNVDGGTFSNTVSISGITGLIYAAGSLRGSDSDSLTFNFGATSYAHTPPVGALNFPSLTPALKTRAAFNYGVEGGTHSVTIGADNGIATLSRPFMIDVTNITLFQFLGPFQTVAQTTALGGDFASYESIWTSNEGADYTEAAGWAIPYDEPDSGDASVGSAVYDRAKIYGVWADRVQAANPSLAATYRTRMNTLLGSYRDNYLSSGVPTEPMNQWYSYACSYLNNGNATSWAHIGDAADRAAYYQGQGWYADLANTDVNMRVVAHAMAALLAARRTNAPSDGASGGFPGGNNWATVLPLVLGDIISTQAADGAWRFVSQNSGNKAYQVGLLGGRLVDYYMYFNADSRIPGVLKKAQNFLWSNMLAANDYFWYGENFGFDETVGSFDATEDTADLNNFHLSSLGLLYYLTGDTTYITRGDRLLAYWVAHAFVSGYKQLSEGLHDSYRYMWFRSQTPLNTMDQGVPIMSVAPAVTGSGTLSVSTGTWSGSPSSYTYQWKRYKTTTPLANVGTNSNSYTPGAGWQVFCEVTPVNGSGAGVPARSNVVTS